MSEIKELNLEELEKISGGSECSETVEGLTFNHSLGDKVITGNYCRATVTKRGYLLFGFYWACIYLVFDDNNPDGWYVDDATLANHVTDELAVRMVIVSE